MYTVPILICVIRIIHPNHEHCNTFPTIVDRKFQAPQAFPALSHISSMYSRLIRVSRHSLGMPS